MYNLFSIVVSIFFLNYANQTTHVPVTLKVGLGHPLPKHNWDLIDGMNMAPVVFETIQCQGHPKCDMTENLKRDAFPV